MDLHNIELEQQILGAILIDNAIIHEISPILEAKHLFDEVHRQLFQIFSERIRAGREVIPATIVNFLDSWPETLEVSSEDYLTRLVQNVAVRGAIKPIAHELRDLSVRREIEALAQVCYDEANDTDPARTVDDSINSIEDAIQDLRAEFHTKQQANSWAHALNDSLQSAGQAYQSHEDPGWEWFLPELEAVVGERLQPGTIVGLLADSGGGKTSLAVQQAAHSAMQNVPVILFSFEQTARQIADQVFAQHIDLESRLWRRGKVTEAEFDSTVDYAKSIQNWPMEVHKMYGARVADLSTRARRFFRKRSPGLIIIDHAKRITPDSGRSNLADQVNQVYGGVKNMALENECAVLLLMQRNMEGYRRNNPRPMRSDVYGGGGAIENLDYCVALWREILWLKEQYPNLTTDEAKSKNEDRQTQVEFKAEMIGLKARFYQQGLARTIAYTPRFTRFSSLRKETDQPKMEF